MEAEAAAIIYAGLGEKGEAFAWPEKAYDEHAFNGLAQSRTALVAGLQASDFLQQPRWHAANIHA